MEGKGNEWAESSCVQSSWLTHRRNLFFFFIRQQKEKKKLKTKNLEDGTSGKNSWQTFNFFLIEKQKKMKLVDKKGRPHPSSCERASD